MTDANAYWEMGLGIDAGKIQVLYNGLRQPGEPTPPPGTRTVVSVGRIDPLKDIHTLLRVAAGDAASCPGRALPALRRRDSGRGGLRALVPALHAQLGLGDRFRFMGRTTDPNGAVRDADVVLMTSISEGLPMSILEAMGQGRPVVSTGVGGVPGRRHGLRRRDPARRRSRARDGGRRCCCATRSSRARLGRRGHARLGRIFNKAACVDGYRDLLARDGDRA